MNYGLVCISEILKEQDKNLAFQSMTRKRFLALDKQEALKILQSRIIHNLELTAKIIEHCGISEINHYRLSSSLFPLVSDAVCEIDFESLPEFQRIRDLCVQVSRQARLSNVSLSLHPDQYNVLASLNGNVVSNTIKELDFLSYILDLMELNKDYSVPINIHPGLSVQGNNEKDFQDFIDRFYFMFLKCSESLRKRLVIENEDKGSWNCFSVYAYFYNYCKTKHGHGFPLTYDNLHDYCNPSIFNGSKVSMIDNIRAFNSTWESEYTPVFHWSWGKDGGRSHDNYCPELPPKFETPIKWEIELKAKDKAIMQMIHGDSPKKDNTNSSKSSEKEAYNFIYKVYR